MAAEGENGTNNFENIFGQGGKGIGKNEAKPKTTEKWRTKEAG